MTNWLLKEIVVNGEDIDSISTLHDDDDYRSWVDYSYVFEEDAFKHIQIDSCEPRKGSHRRNPSFEDICSSNDKSAPKKPQRRKFHEESNQYALSSYESGDLRDTLKFLVLDAEKKSTARSRLLENKERKMKRTPRDSPPPLFREFIDDNIIELVDTVSCHKIPQCKNPTFEEKYNKNIMIAPTKPERKRHGLTGTFCNFDSSVEFTLLEPDFTEILGKRIQNENPGRNKTEKHGTEYPKNPSFEVLQNLDRSRVAPQKPARKAPFHRFKQN